MLHVGERDRQDSVGGVIVIVDESNPQTGMALRLQVHMFLVCQQNVFRQTSCQFGSAKRVKIGVVRVLGQSVTPTIVSKLKAGSCCSMYSLTQCLYLMRHDATGLRDDEGRSDV